MVKAKSGLWREISEGRVRPGIMVFWWIHQAGVALKTPGGTIAVADGYE
jgi:hypothetical protein